MVKKSTEEYRSDITMHLTRMSGDIDHIKENMDSINSHLEIMNGRLRESEQKISAITGIGSTLIFVIGSILTWLGVHE